MASATYETAPSPKKRRAKLLVAGSLAFLAAWLRIPYSGSDVPRLGRRRAG